MQASGKPGKLIIICGLPGSGKTTLAKRLEGELQATRFSPDEWMEALSLDLYDEAARRKIEALQWRTARGLIARGLTERRYLPATPEVLFDRIQRRGLEDPPIGRDKVSRWFEMFEAPTPEEMALFDA
jgi:pantothenate kinase-related protein Tda10